MNKTTKFKKAEKLFLENVANIFSFIQKKLKNFFSIIGTIASHKITIMMIPHSEKKVFNLRINLFFLSVFLCISRLIIRDYYLRSIDNYNKSLQFRQDQVELLLKKKSREYKEKSLTKSMTHIRTHKVKLDALNKD